MSGVQLQEFRAGNLLCHRSDHRGRPQSVMPAGSYQCGAGDFAQFGGNVLGREHAVDGSEALRIIGQPTRAEISKYIGVVADHGRVGVRQAGLDDASHAAGLDCGGAFHRLLPAFRGNPGRGPMQHQSGDAIRVAHGKMHRNRRTDSDAGDRDLAGNAQSIQQPFQVVRHVVPGDDAADLLGQPSAARVVTQDAAVIVERTQSLGPTVEGLHDDVDRLGGFGVGLILFSFSRIFWLSAAILVPMGYCMIVAMAASNTLIQSMVPDTMRGRVMAVYSMMFMGMAPLGALAAGALAGHIGAPWTVRLGGMLSIVAAAGFASRLPALRGEARELIVAMQMEAGAPPQEMTGTSNH